MMGRLSPPEPVSVMERGVGVATETTVVQPRQQRTTILRTLSPVPAVGNSDGVCGLRWGGLRIEALLPLHYTYCTYNGMVAKID